MRTLHARPIGRGAFLGAAAVLLAACGPGSAFACLDDAECTLAGTPGICQGSGHCAYPDPSCPTGYRYPVGVPGVLGGTCAGEGAPPSGTGTGSGSVGGASSGGPTGNATSSGEGGETSGPSVTAGSGTLPSDTGDRCAQEAGEPNDEIDQATELLGTDCAFAVTGAVGGPDTLDVFAPAASACPGPWRLDIEAADALPRCLRFTCDGAGSPTVNCTGGPAIGGSEFATCCGTQTLESQATCATGTLRTFLEVEGNRTCTEYTLTLEPN